MLNKIKNNRKIIIIFSVTILAILGAILYFKMNNSSKNMNSIIAQSEIDESDIEVTEYKYEDTKNDLDESNNKELEKLINISDCSEEFMEKYYEDVQELQDIDNKENIIIVISEIDIEDTYGATKIVKAPNNQYMLQYTTEEEKNNAIKRFNKSNNILYAEENSEYSLLESNYNSWGIEEMGLDSAISVGNEHYLNEMTVAIIDGGCNMSLFNEYFPGRIKETYEIYKSTNSSNSGSGIKHGTHIAGTIAEATTSNVNILPVRINIGGNENVFLSDLINALNYINYYKKADVINMSLGYNKIDMSLYASIEALNKNGVICVVAAGNEGSNEKQYPAAFDNTISVSAIDSEKKLAKFSSYGDTITFTAPGVDIVSINGNMSGTSMATPHVVSAVAMLKSVNKSLNLEQAISILKDSVIDLGEPGWDQYFGYGLIDLSNFDVLINKTKNVDIIDFEIQEPRITISKNYGNITNLMNVKIKLIDGNGNEIIKLMGDIDDIEIENYNAFSSEEQNVTIKYKDIVKTIIVRNTITSINMFKTSVDDEGFVSINGVRERNCPKKIYIPDIINGNTVKKIGENAFESGEINTMILPDSIKSIDNGAFYNSSIKEIKGKTVEIFVGDKAFQEAYKLEVFEPTITKIGQYAFNKCYGLDNIVISNNVKTIEEYAFCDCINLENLNIPNQLEEIKDYALSGTRIKNLNIPKTLINIKTTAFRGCTGLEYINVENQNPIYDSRNNCNALINTKNNSIMLGTCNTIIPSTIYTIEAYAFYNNNKIKTINTNNVEYIGDYAFEGCYNLEIYLNEKVSELGTHALYRLFTVYIYNSALAQEVMNNNSPVNLIELFDFKINVLCKDKYKAFDRINDVQINIEYNAVYAETKSLLKESINDNYRIEYENGGDSLKYGDTYFIIYAKNKHGMNIEKRVDCIVEKADPDYIVPFNIQAVKGQKLSDITLPSGFEWMNGNEIINETGNIIYKAKYIPEDIENYEIVENIDISISVENAKTVIIPNISLGNKTYDGTTQINISDITVSNLNNFEYSIVSAILSSADVGERTATIKLRLSNEKYGEYSFDNGKQEKEFEVEVNIIPADANIKYSASNLIYKYDGELYGIELNLESPSNASIKYANENDEYILDKMPKYSEIGTYTIKYRIYINENYTDIYGENTLAIVEDYVIGDINGDGKVNIKDWNRLYNHINETEHLSDYQLLCADINGDGKVNIKDWNRMYDHITEVNPLW